MSTYRFQCRDAYATEYTAAIDMSKWNAEVIYYKGVMRVGYAVSGSFR